MDGFLEWMSQLNELGAIECSKQTIIQDGGAQFNLNLGRFKTLF